MYIFQRDFYLKFVHFLRGFSRLVVFLLLAYYICVINKKNIKMFTIILIPICVLLCIFGFFAFQLYSKINTQLPSVIGVSPGYLNDPNNYNITITGVNFSEKTNFVINLKFDKDISKSVNCNNLNIKKGGIKLNLNEAIKDIIGQMKKANKNINYSLPLTLDIYLSDTDSNTPTSFSIYIINSTQITPPPPITYIYLKINNESIFHIGNKENGENNNIIFSDIQLPKPNNLIYLSMKARIISEGSGCASAIKIKINKDFITNALVNKPVAYVDWNHRTWDWFDSENTCWNLYYDINYSKEDKYYLFTWNISQLLNNDTNRIELINMLEKKIDSNGHEIKSDIEVLYVKLHADSNDNK